ncbi:hypothetical protein BH23GEM9_BH23GEM9_35110 [soil metagenome]
MKSRSIVTALVVMLLAPLPLLAQQGGGQGRGGMAGGGLMGARVLMEQGSVEFLTTKAADLQLNEEQVPGLKVIGEKWATDTKEDRAKVLAELPQGGQGAGGDRQAMMQRLQGLQPVMQKIREADQLAVTEALKLLNETQQAAATKLIEERRQPRRPPGM